MVSMLKHARTKLGLKQRQRFLVLNAGQKTKPNDNTERAAD